MLTNLSNSAAQTLALGQPAIPSEWLPVLAANMHHMITPSIDGPIPVGQPSFVSPPTMSIGPAAATPAAFAAAAGIQSQGTLQTSPPFLPHPRLMALRIEGASAGSSGNSTPRSGASSGSSSKRSADEGIQVRYGKRSKRVPKPSAKARALEAAADMGGIGGTFDADKVAAVEDHITEKQKKDHSYDLKFLVVSAINNWIQEKKRFPKQEHEKEKVLEMFEDLYPAYKGHFGGTASRAGGKQMLSIYNNNIKGALERESVRKRLADREWVDSHPAEAAKFKNQQAKLQDMQKLDALLLQIKSYADGPVTSTTSSKAANMSVANAAAQNKQQLAQERKKQAKPFLEAAERVKQHQRLQEGMLRSQIRSEENALDAREDRSQDRERGLMLQLAEARSRTAICGMGAMFGEAIGLLVQSFNGDEQSVRRVEQQRQRQEEGVAIAERDSAEIQQKLCEAMQARAKLREEVAEKRKYLETEIDLTCSHEGDDRQAAVSEGEQQVAGEGNGGANIPADAMETLADREAAIADMERSASGEVEAPLLDAEVEEEL
jgi:hypothetical protein